MDYFLFDFSGVQFHYTMSRAKKHLNSNDSLICRSWFCPSLIFFIHGGFDAYRHSSKRLPFLNITIYAKDE